MSTAYRPDAAITNVIPAHKLRQGDRFEYRNVQYTATDLWFTDTHVYVQVDDGSITLPLLRLRVGEQVVRRASNV